MTEVTFTVPDVPPGINRLMNMHWAKRHQRRTDWSWLIRQAAAKPDVRTLKAWADLGYKVSIQMHVTTMQLFDEDNLASLAKWPIDIMRHLQWLVNDDPGHLVFEKPTQEKGKKSIRFTIRRLA